MTRALSFIEPITWSFSRLIRQFTSFGATFRSHSIDLCHHQGFSWLSRSFFMERTINYIYLYCHQCIFAAGSYCGIFPDAPRQFRACVRSSGNFHPVLGGARKADSKFSNVPHFGRPCLAGCPRVPPRMGCMWILRMYWVARARPTPNLQTLHTLAGPA